MTSCSKAVPVGNYEAKYETRNPVSRFLVNGFLKDFDDLAAKAAPASIHEVGCGEGELIRRLVTTNASSIRGTDISSDVFSAASQDICGKRVSFQEKSVYDLTPETDSADLLVCCEVLEHVDRPDAALEALYGLGAGAYLFSVPREPIWRILNMARGKYLGDFGNTPGHLNHWSRGGFLRWISQRFEILETRSPLPWTMALCKAR